MLASHRNTNIIVFIDFPEFIFNLTKIIVTVFNIHIHKRKHTHTEYVVTSKAKKKNEDYRPE